MARRPKEKAPASSRSSSPTSEQIPRSPAPQDASLSPALHRSQLMRPQTRPATRFATSRSLYLHPATMVDGHGECQARAVRNTERVTPGVHEKLTHFLTHSRSETFSRRTDKGSIGRRPSPLRTK